MAAADAAQVKGSVGVGGKQQDAPEAVRLRVEFERSGRECGVRKEVSCVRVECRRGGAARLLPASLGSAPMQPLLSRAVSLRRRAPTWMKPSIQFFMRFTSAPTGPTASATGQQEKEEQHGQQLRPTRF